MSGNPFDPFAAPPAAASAAVGGGGYGTANAYPPSQGPGMGDPWGGQTYPTPQQPQQQQPMYGGMPPPQQQQQQQQQQLQQQYQQPPPAQAYPGMPPPPQQQQQLQPPQPAPAPTPVSDPWGAPYPSPPPTAATSTTEGYNPFAAVPDAQGQLQQQQQQQLVLSQQQSNPYGGIVAPTYTAAAVPQPSMMMVPAAAPTPGVAWGAAPPQQQQQQQQPQPYATAASAATSFDPFAVAPPPPPAPAPVPDPMMMMMVQHQQQQQQPQSPPQQQQQQQQQAENPFGDFLPPAPAAPEPPPPRPADVVIVSQQQEQHQMQPYHGGGGGGGGQRGGDDSRAMVPAARNPYSQEIARKAAPYGASPLPKAELVKKTGYILSRISFRTIVMKKWKQSFWVQYGSHTMLWFRAEEDFKDWLNNPYHTQAQRNFLIKLAVNFVHDLYKPNVRGYQVTQSRVKPYGNKMVRQFKLERWMDYGPTIAAAFGSYDIKEVEDLRKAIVECMRNTPLENGIKATGAVQQLQPQQPRLQQHPHNGGTGGGGGGREGPEDGYGQNNGPSGRRHTMGGTYPMERDLGAVTNCPQGGWFKYLTSSMFLPPLLARLLQLYAAHHFHTGSASAGDGSSFGRLGNRLVG